MPSARSTTLRGSSFSSTTTKARSGRRYGPSSSTSTTSQIVTRLPGNESIAAEGKAAALVQEQGAKLHLANTTTVTTGAAVLLRDINNYLRGGMLTLGAIAVGDHDRDPARAVQGAVAVAAAAGGARRRDLGVRARGIPRDPAHHRDDRRAARDARHRHRLRDPDARSGRGRSGDRPRRTPDPGDRAEPRARAAGRHLRRDLCVCRVALRQGSDDPRLRVLLAVGIAVICLCSIILPLAILGIREFKSPTKGRDFRSGPLGRLVVWLGSVPSRRRSPLRNREHRHLRRRHRGRRQAHAPDRPATVGQPEQPDHQGHQDGRAR